MTIKWKRRFKPDLVLTNIEAARTVSPEGGVSFRGFDVQEDVETLASMLDFPLAAEHFDKVELVWSAVSYEREPLNSQNVLQALNAQLRKRLSKQISSYSLLTTLSIDRKLLPPRIELSDATVFVYQNGLPQRLHKIRSDLENRPLDIPKTPSDYTWIRVRVKQKSPEAAARQALQQLGLLRGIIALFSNYEMQSSYFSSGSHGALNRVRTGGMHTVHLPTGAAASELLWYEPKFKPTQIYKSSDPASWVRAFNNTLKRTLSANYSTSLVASLIQYSEAFDEPDHGNAFLKLWSGLELLASPTTPINYDDIVRRCSFMHSTGDFEAQVLQHLREHRNALTHRGSATGDARIKCYQLQRYYRQAVLFYSHSGKKFTSLRAANEFLDLPADRKELKARIELLKRAITYLQPEPKSSRRKPETGSEPDDSSD